MKKRISIILIALLVLATLLGTFCYATEIQPRVSTETEGGINPISLTDSQENEQIETTTPTIDDYDVTYSDLYVFEDKDYELESNKLVDGNAYIFANGDVKISGQVNGSIFIIANGTVEFAESSGIYDTLYVLAQEVKINGAIYDIYSLSDKFEIMENGYISRDIRVMADNVKLRGTVHRDAYLEAENIDVKDDEGALSIDGNFNYTSKKEIQGLEDIVLYGKINFNLEEENAGTISTGEKILGYVSSAVTSIIYALVIYFLIGLIAPKFIERVGKDIQEKTLLPFIVGLVTWVAITMAIVISIMLVFTSYGSAVAIIAWTIMFIIIYISSAVFSMSVLGFVKTKITQIQENKALEICALAVIALCVWILQKIPFIGGLCSFIILTTGIGLIIRNIIPLKEKDKTTIETKTNVE